MIPTTPPDDGPARRTSATRQVIPELPCSVPPRIHPDYPTILEWHAAWVRTFLPPSGPDPTAVPRPVQQRLALFDATVVPFGPWERLLRSACMTTAITLADDYAIFERVLYDEIAEEEERSDSTLGRAFADVWSSMRRDMPPSVYERLRGRWRDWFKAVSEEATIRQGVGTRDLAHNLDLRVTSVGMKPYAVIAEYLLDLDLTDLDDDPELAALGDAMAQHVFLCNDAISYRKERHQGDGAGNTVASLTRIHGYSVEQAMDEVLRRARAVDQERNRLTALLHRRYADHPDGDRFHAYLDSYGQMCSGCLYWELESIRYHGSGHVWDGRRSYEIPLDDGDDSLMPIGSADAGGTTGTTGTAGTGAAPADEGSRP